MSEHFEHNLGDHEDPVPGPTWLLGAIGTVLLLVILFGLIALFYNAYNDAREAKVMTRKPWNLEQYQMEQQRKLTGPPRTEVRFFAGDDRELFIIPIDDAMRLVVEEGGR